MTNGIFPPILNGSQPAFPAETAKDKYSIYFSFPAVADPALIKHIQIKVTQQSNNKSIVNTKLYPDGIIYKNYSFSDNISDETNIYYVNILPVDLVEFWQPGVIYKIQIRFGSTTIYEELSDFTEWKQEQIENGTFSEWSTVMAVKCIDTPEIKIKKSNEERDSMIETYLTESSASPTFYGMFSLPNYNKEFVNQYQFTLYTKDDELIEQSEWLIHHSVEDTQDTSIDSYRFKTILENNKSYKVIYSIITMNNYTASSNAYNFIVSESYYDDIKGVNIRFEDDSIFCRENGCISGYITSNHDLFGSYVVIRSSEKDNYAVWEDMKFFIWGGASFEDELFFNDFTIESGVRYKYALQKVNREGLRTSPLFPRSSNPLSVDLEYSYLYHDGIQLCLKFNNKLSSFKHTVLTSKQDTLGSKYATIVRNGHAYYAEFPIAGLISMHMDENELFFERRNDGYYYKNELVIPKVKYDIDEEKRHVCQENGEAPNAYSEDKFFGTDILDNNIFIERKFREKVEEFLNDGESKLFRSPTEGNIIVSLLNISFTPIESLSRMIYNFSATAYEVMENTYDNLSKSGIMNVGEYAKFAIGEIQLTFGQISGVFKGLNSRGSNSVDYGNRASADNLFQIIKRQVEQENEDGGYSLQKIRSLQIMPHPILDYRFEIAEIEAEISEMLEKSQLIPSKLIEKLINYRTLADALKSEEKYPVITIQMNGDEVSIGKNRNYCIKNLDNIESIYLKYTIPVLINYTCEVVPVEKISQSAIAVETSRIWGQLRGIFTETAEILNNYNYKYLLGDYQLENLDTKEDNFLINPEANASYNVYRTENLLDIIKQKAKEQITKIYSAQWTSESSMISSNYYWNYDFLDVLAIEIEANPGTVLLLNQEDAQTKVSVIIGPTGKYTVNPAEKKIETISFEDPTYALVNYKVLTRQTKIGLAYINKDTIGYEGLWYIVREDKFNSLLNYIPALGTKEGGYNNGTI